MVGIPLSGPGHPNPGKGSWENRWENELRPHGKAGNSHADLIGFKGSKFSKLLSVHVEKDCCLEDVKISERKEDNSSDDKMRMADAKGREAYRENLLPNVSPSSWNESHCLKDFQSWAGTDAQDTPRFLLMEDEPEYGLERFFEVSSDDDNDDPHLQGVDMSIATNLRKKGHKNRKGGRHGKPFRSARKVEALWQSRNG